jgi:hypothetical protein
MSTVQQVLISWRRASRLLPAFRRRTDQHEDALLLVFEAASRWMLSAQT